MITECDNMYNRWVLDCRECTSFSDYENLSFDCPLIMRDVFYLDWMDIIESPEDWKRFYFEYAYIEIREETTKRWFNCCKNKLKDCRDFDDFGNLLLNSPRVFLEVIIRFIEIIGIDC